MNTATRTEMYPSIVYFFNTVFQGPDVRLFSFSQLVARFCFGRVALKLQAVMISLTLTIELQNILLSLLLTTSVRLRFRDRNIESWELSESKSHLQPQNTLGDLCDKRPAIYIRFQLP